MVDEMLYRVSLEVVEYWYGDGAVCQCSQDGRGPLATVASAEGDFVAVSYAGVFEEDV